MVADPVERLALDGGGHHRRVDRRSPAPRSRATTLSILVVDVGTSGVRAAIVRPDATVEHVHHREVLPSSPSPGFVEFDAREMADAALDGRDRLRSRTADPSKRSASRTSGRRRSCGTRPPASPWRRASDGKTCALRGCASCSRPRAPASRRTSPRRSSRSCSTWPIPTGRATTFGSARSTRGSRGSCPTGRCTSPTSRTSASPGWCATTATDGTSTCSTSSVSPAASFRRSSIRRGSSATRPPWRALRPSRGSPVTSRHRSSARGVCCPAWRRRRSAPAACSTCASAQSDRHSSDAVRAAHSRSQPGGRTVRSRGASRRSC